MIRLDKIEREISFKKYAINYLRSFFYDVNGKYISNNPKKRTLDISKKYKRGNKRAFLHYLTRDNYKKIDDIIVGNVKSLNSIINQVNEIFPQGNPFWEFRNGQPASTPFGREIASIFSYNSLRNKVRDYNLLKFLDIRTCPYCNQTEVFAYDNNGNVVLASYDHFFPQVYHPYFSISIYNIIPSCHYCNCQLKKSTNFTTKEFIHPYLEDFDQKTSFTLGGDVIQNDNDDSFTIKITPNLKRTKSYRTINHFHVLDRYNQRKDIVLRIWKLRQLHPDSQIKNILNTYSNLAGRNITAQEFWETNIDFNFSSNKILYKPYNKLKKDIAKEFFIVPE